MTSNRDAAAALRIGIVGTGLIGTSLGLALRPLTEVAAVVGYDAAADELAEAKRRGALTDVAATPAAAAADADVVVLAVPVSVLPAVAAEVAPALRPGAILTDVASVKSEIVAALEALAPHGVHVVGGHPMAGSHEHGAAHASADLFVGATYLLTPTATTDPGAYGAMTRLVGRLGARALAVDPAAHDLLVAVISHLPQLAATTLMNLAAERARTQHAGLLLLAAGGFRDATRVAASNPELWLDICRENRRAIVEVLDEFAARIGQLRMTLAEGDEAKLSQLLADARDARRGLPGKETVSGQLVELLLAIPDRPGVLAEVTTTVGALGVNIEDFGIEHAPEGGRGQLRLVVSGVEEADRARDALEARGFEVVERAS